MLWLGIRRSFPGDEGLAAVAGEIEDRLGYRPEIAAGALRREHLQRMSRIIGWSEARTLGQMIDREWLAGDQNELAPLAETLAGCGSLAEATSVLICGAGACGLGAHLASLDHICSVRCTDLSFLGLFFGRLLSAGRPDLLPTALRGPLTILSVDARGERLEDRLEVRVFHRATTGREKLTYEVADVFGPGRGGAEDLVCVPYLLDAFHEAQMTTALIRICERLAPGQRLLLVVTANPRRDPRRLIGTLEGCGLAVDRLRLCSLPYSLSEAGYAFVRTEYQTLIAEATKVEETDRAKVRLVPLQGSEKSTLREDQGLPGQRERPLPLSFAQWDAAESALRLRRLEDVERSLTDALGEPLTQGVLAYATAGGWFGLVLDG